MSEVTSKAQLIAYAAAAALLVFVGVRLLDGGEGTGGSTPVVSVDGGGEAGSATSDGRVSGSGSSEAELYVHVAGAVRRPGLYRVPRGSRTAVAIELAGGLGRRAELTGVNLAAPLQDGQQVIVPRKGEVAVSPTGAAGAAGSATTGAGAPAAPISLATATPEQLDSLDGIGPTLAARIIEYRDSHGGFRSLGELRQVDGIGEKRFEALREGVRP